jgi:regulatory protein
LPGPRRSREPTHPLPLHDRALGLLAVRPRSRHELLQRLVSAGFDRRDVEDELARLEAVGLVDDEQFAHDFVEHAVGRRLEGRRSVTSSLMAKGVDRGTIERTLDGVGTDDETRAVELARLRAGRLRSVPPEAAYRRLVSFLARRGYDGGIARRAARLALAVDGSEE